MLLPFLACLILTGIHVYFGIHVVQRGIIFVDISLAQVAALGSIIGMLFEFRLHTTASYFFSLAFTFLAATVFTFTRFKEYIVPQEAMIGIIYAIATAISFLVLDRIPEEAGHIKHMLVGNILFISWPQLIKMTALYGVVGIFHFIFRKEFTMITLDVAQAKEKKVSIRLWDFLFYISFGIIITSSIEIAGVLLVFSYLIIPSVCAMLLSNRLNIQLIIGWALSAITSLAGLYVSATFDYLPGSMIICIFGVMLILVMIFQKLFVCDRNRIEFKSH